MRSKTVYGKMLNQNELIKTLYKRVAVTEIQKNECVPFYIFVLMNQLLRSLVNNNDYFIVAYRFLRGSGKYISVYKLQSHSNNTNRYIVGNNFESGDFNEHRFQTEIFYFITYVPNHPLVQL